MVPNAGFYSCSVGTVDNSGPMSRCECANLCSASQNCNVARITQSGGCKMCKSGFREASPSSGNTVLYKIKDGVEQPH